MKNVCIIITSLIFFFSCNVDYKLSTEFRTPTKLVSPEFIKLDVKSQELIVFSWSGGGASDGSYVSYEVLFDKKGGDFSSPLAKLQSTYGTDENIKIEHKILNRIAGKAGILAEEAGEIVWTVTASKGGIISPSDITKTIEIERPTGIDPPENLYLLGNATENGGSEGLQFRLAEEGLFIIYTKINNAGNLRLKSEKDGNNEDGINYYVSGDLLKEGNGDFAIEPSDDKIYRITVDFNTLSMTAEKIGEVRAIWGATFGAIGILEYTENGIFKADNCLIEFISPDRLHTNPPSWLGWVENRYYFIANVDGTDICWGRINGISSESPIGNESLSFYQLGEFVWDQWEHLWKMSGSLDETRATIIINTNKNNLKVHEFTNVVPM